MNGVSQAKSREAYPLLVEALKLSGSLRLPATGTSMVPAIHPRDVITVQPIESNEVTIGDVVVYSRDHALVVHRVVGMFVDKDERRLVTRGDRLLKDDEPIDLSDVLGKVVRVQRRNRRLSLRPVKSAAHQTLCQVLRRSDRATSVFLRASALLNGIIFKRNAGPA